MFYFFFSYHWPGVFLTDKESSLLLYLFPYVCLLPLLLVLWLLFGVTDLAGSNEMNVIK